MIAIGRANESRGFQMMLISIFSNVETEERQLIRGKKLGWGTSGCGGAVLLFTDRRRITE